MNGEEILKTYPAAAKVITAWLLKELIASCDKPEIPGDFKDFVIQTGLSEERVADIIDDSPRMLFDVFDAHNIFIDINKSSKGFQTNVYKGDNILVGDGYGYNTRKEADSHGLKIAFETFNDDLIDSIKVIDEKEIKNTETL